MIEVGAASHPPCVRIFNCVHLELFEVVNIEGLVASLRMGVGKVNVRPLLVVKGIVYSLGQLVHAPIVHFIEVVLLEHVLEHCDFPAVSQYEVVLASLR